MARGTRYTEEMVREYLEKGPWTRELTVDFWDRNALLYPYEEALVDSRTRVTWSQAKRQIDRIALGLIDLGFKGDDVLLAQLYNCVELVLLRLACEKAGVLLAIVPHTFRHAELDAVLNQIGAKGAFIPHEFRGFDYFEAFQEIRSQHPGLKHLFVVGDNVPQDAISVREMTQQPLERKYPLDLLQRSKFDPFGFEEIMTTSGTTGVPKCVEWSGCARLSQGRDVIERLHLTRNDVLCAFSPSYGATIETLTYRSSPQVGAKTVMLEHFTPEEACRLIEKEKITVGGIVPTMIVRLLNYPNLDRYDLRSLRILLSSAAMLHYQVAIEAEEKLGCTIVQGYGSMDSGGVCLGSVDDPPEARRGTVGRPLTGNQVRLVDEEGREVSRGEVGLVTVSGPHCIGGYYNDPEATRRSWQDGRFRLGDLGRFDEAGRLQLMGRQKDVIIRGGQNIYPKEIEDLLVQYPKIAEVAVVKMPDREMGEKACAYVVVREGKRLTFEEMVSFLKEKGIAKFKLPERLETVDAFMLVPGGNKVNKRLLEEEITQKLKEEGGISI